MSRLPYDDLNGWHGPYPPVVLAAQFDKVAQGWTDGLVDLQQEGCIRLVGASVHDRDLARQLVGDPHMDVLMCRYNMAYRKAAAEVFPAARAAQTPVIAFTATRWRTLLQPQPDWYVQPPSAADCYCYCLAQPAVHLVLTIPKFIEELDENVRVLRLPPKDEDDCKHWGRFSDLVYGHGGGGTHEFESCWP